jgi:hypothetical protein
LAQALVVAEPIADVLGDDQLLLARAAGEADAFAMLYRRHNGAVLGFLPHRIDGLLASRH